MVSVTLRHNGGDSFGTMEDLKEEEDKFTAELDLSPRKLCGGAKSGLLRCLKWCYRSTASLVVQYLFNWVLSLWVCHAVSSFICVSGLLP